MDLLERVRPRLAPRMVVLLSGGRDSVCLLDCAVRAGADVVALHVNYRLRAGADADEAFCRDLCARVDVELAIERPPAGAGNMHAWARDARYEAAAALAERRGARVASAHTATDQVETVLYRLAASPGRRAILGMGEQRALRPLLECTREETAAHCLARGLAWREDPSNDDPRFARARVRHELVDALRRVHPAAEANLLRTVGELRDEAEVLDAIVERSMTDRVEELRGMAPALRRLVLRRLGVPPARAEDVLALEGGTKHLDLGRGLRAVVEYGRVRVEPAAPPAATPGPVSLHVPGEVPFAGGLVVAEPAADGALDGTALGERVEVRSWRDGDRMRPAGLGGTRTLQDLFTDRKVPRGRRRAIPVVVAADGDIAWVAGVATGERFRATDGTARRVRLAWVGFDA